MSSPDLHVQFKFDAQKPRLLGHHTAIRFSLVYKYLEVSTLTLMNLPLNPDEFSNSEVLFMYNNHRSFIFGC